MIVSNFIGLLRLVPDRIRFDQFWIEIRKRNRWLIMLRYGAAAMLTCLIAGIYILQNFFPKFSVNTFPLWIIAFVILIYNFIFHRLWIYFSRRRTTWAFGRMPDFSKRRFHSLHFSLVQIIADFIALLLFIYYTGGVETPLFGFFIFHVIIGSIFLPGTIVSLIVTGTLLISISGAVLEYYGKIPHYQIQGLLPFTLYDNPAYLIIYFTFFAIMLYVSIYLANSVAKELYQRHRALAEAYRKLEEAEKSKSRYVMSVVHDLKTPIAAATTYLNMLLDGTLGALVPEHLRPIERSKVRLLNAINTINDILYISQLKLGEDSEASQPVNLNEIIDEIYKELLVLIDSKHIEFTVDSIPDTGVVFKCDSKLMKIALANILSNAYKYSEAHGKINVRIEEKQDSIIISVADCGIGVPEKEINKIFNEFYRSSISKKLGIEGTGLGMSIVQQIIDRYGGKIVAHSPSRIGSPASPGTEFVITFPIN